jgi:hypothetical protein
MICLFLIHVKMDNFYKKKALFTLHLFEYRKILKHVRNKKKQEKINDFYLNTLKSTI